MPFIVENLVQYDLSEQDAAVLESFGFIFADGESENPDERVTTALVWEELGLVGDSAFLLFDVVLGRGGAR
jgi:hypothetical protein